MPSLEHVMSINTDLLVNQFSCKHKKSVLPLKFVEKLNTSSFNLNALKGPDKMMLLTLNQWSCLCTYIKDLRRIILMNENLEVKGKLDIFKNSPVMIHKSTLTPELCLLCHTERLKEQHNWSNQPIIVTKLSTNDAIPAQEKACDLNSTRRVSKRHTKKFREIRVSASDTLAKLRLHIYEQLGERLLDQEIFFNGCQLPLDKEDLTLEYFQIEPYSNIYLRYADKKYSRDIRAQLEDSTLNSLLLNVGCDGKIRREGFSGTFLGGYVEKPFQAASDSNKDTLESSKKDLEVTCNQKIDKDFVDIITIS